MLLADAAERGQTVRAWHAEVEQDEVRLGAVDEGKHLRARGGLPDDLEVARFLERPLDPIDDQLVVVRDHDAHVRLPSPFSISSIVVGGSDVSLEAAG